MSLKLSALALIADFGSALIIELRRGNPPDLRDFLRFRFRNGTQSDFKTLYVYGHRSDIALTEFIYKSKVCTRLLTPGEVVTY